MPITAQSDLLTSSLKAARRRWIAFAFCDALVIALIAAAGVFVALRLAGYPAAWVFGAAMLASGVVAWRRVPSLLTVAQRLDADSQSAELFSTAWLLGSDGDAWSQILIDQANQQIEQAVRNQPTPGMAAGFRNSLILIAGALTACGLLIRPADNPAASQLASQPAASPSETLRAAAWLTPPTRKQITDDPDEAGRSIPMPQSSATARPRQAGNDSRGGGRADATAKAKTSLDGGREKLDGKASPDRRGASGSGPASLDTAGETADATGTVHGGDRVTAGGESAMGDIGAPHGDAGDSRPIDPRYRDFIRDYFAR